MSIREKNTGANRVSTMADENPISPAAFRPAADTMRKQISSDPSAVMETEMYCPKCGKMNPEGSVYCNGCGFPLSSGSVSGTDPPAEPKKEKRFRGGSVRNALSTAWTLLSVIFAAGVIIFIAVTWFTILSEW